MVLTNFKKKKKKKRNKKEEEAILKDKIIFKRNINDHNEKKQ
jgi:hypothetical protein